MTKESKKIHWVEENDTAEKPMISVIVISYNSSTHIARCLDSLQGFGAEVVVVDNASSDGTADLLRERFPSAKLISSPTNLGFAAAANLGVRHSVGSSLLFLNPDTVCLDALSPLEEALESSERVAAVAPRLVDRNGRTQVGFTVRRLPTATSLIFEILALNRLFPNNPVNRKFRCLDLDHEGPSEVEQPAGACLLVRRTRFESCGGFDEAFFPLWFEDVDLCKRLREQGGTILFLPQVRVQHHGAHSLESLTVSEKQIYWYRNLLYYVRKHFPWRTGVVIRGALVGGMGLRMMAELVGGVVSRDATAPRRRERLRAYWSVAKLSVRGVSSGAGSERGFPSDCPDQQGWQAGRKTMGTGKNLVSVTIVTHNSEPYLRRCLDSVLAQTWPWLEVIVVDNASQDRTRSLLTSYRDRVRLIPNSENRGFAAAQNQAIRQAKGEWILVLNPDTFLAANFVSSLVRGGTLDPAAGTVCGKLLRALPGLEIPPERQLDSAGIYFTPTFRHFDRGFHRPDSEEYDQPAYVFGATAAAAMYRRSMIEDVSIEGEFFDEDFFFYREDADVSWRAQLQGWRCLYLPEAVGYHVRRVSPDCRRQLPNAINFHSVKNRFLMRIKNVTWPLYLRNFFSVTARDLAIVAYCLMVERSSVPAFRAVLDGWQRMLAKRRIIQQRRRVSHAYLNSWFRFRPTTVPVELPRSEAQSVAAPSDRESYPILPLRTTRPEPGRIPPL